MKADVGSQYGEILVSRASLTRSAVAFVHQRSIHDFSGYGVKHRQRLLTSM